MTDTIPSWISADEVYARVSFEAAIRAIQRDLKAGIEPSEDFARSIQMVNHGQLMLMPAQSSEFVGIKVLTLAPGNPALGKAIIQAVYLLMDAITLSPVAVIDGTALTTLRTPATSAAVADLLAPDQIEHLVVFGSGPQAWGHVEAMRAIRTISTVTIVDIDPERALALVTRVGASGLHARVGSADDVRDAQLIVCATTARTPLFDGNLVRDDSLTVAVGAYEPDTRELDSELIRRAQLVVDDTRTALREAGDVIIPIAEGVIESASLIPMRDIITGTTLVDHQRPRVFKSTGMSWEDLVVAAEVFRAG
jgi:ornithine cyclodeaminase